MITRRTLINSGLAATAVAAMPRAAFAGAKAIVPPFKLFDCHAHFYTNQPDKYPFNAKGARYGADVMIKKAMAHPTTPEAVFAVWDEAGIAKGLGVQYNSTYSTDNRYLLDIAAQYPDRILPVVILNPTDGATALTLELLARYRGITGVRFTGVADESANYAFLSDAAELTWQAADQLGLTITLMPIGAGVPKAMEKIARLAETYPNVHIILDHIGFPRPEALPDTFGLTPGHLALAQHKNIFYKYTTLLIEQLQEAKVPTAPFLEHMVGVYGADQMVWGTDIGNTEGSIVDWTQAALRSAQGLPTAQQKAIFHDTAQRVFVPGGRGPRA